ncbi:hypothetical protein Z517_03221 [Fonsecaea pedrosoi CBS 271.37]|uniref:Uncharacterized protein n=1 Tax=Fonsecaea pedrosoi CBS 271.37 TaxID=1442368 RepID=A0A0D2GZE6_9EURO|nr:uncharacterized protein Z517_03221 [Fonsecaea pedrosoi CBS 271.37]KIW83975.1 hypothetical protein Z517_03221 [Fonsecaea pedrosoi CBS 271.37]
MLCSVCLDIPFDNLPEFPQTYYTPWVSWKYIIPYNLDYRARSSRQRGGVLGFPHHPDLQALRISAADCDLCRLILEQVDLVFDEFRAVHNDRAFRDYHRDGYPTGSLFLARRRDTGKGFLVLSHSDVRDTVFLLGAIGLAVPEGKMRM